MQLLKTIIFFIVLIYFIVHANKYFFNVYGVVQRNTTKILLDYNKIFYIYIPLVFLIASTSRYFYHSDGIFELYIKRAIHSLDEHKKYFNDSSFFSGGMSILAIYIYSLIAVASEAGVADEGMIIYTSISILIYLYFKLKPFLGLKEIYTEIIIYLGIAVGFTIVYGSMISTFIYIVETMLINKDMNFFTNVGIMVCAIPFIKYLVGEKESFIRVEKLTFDIKYYGFIALFSVIMGIIAFLFFNAIVFLLNYIKKSKYNNFIILGLGFILAFIIKQLGFLTFGIGESAIENAFNHNSDKEELEKEKNKDKEKLEKLGNNNNNNNNNNNTDKQEQEQELEKDISKDNKKIKKITKFSEYNVIGRIVNCIISVGCGLTGGILVPAMTIGCGLGSVLSKYTSMEQNNLMYLGITAFLSPFLHAPVTSAVVINRIANQPYTSLPVSLGSSFISYLTYNFMNKKFI
jgi:H+/Cl- antiporter ClcA